MKSTPRAAKADKLAVPHRYDPFQHPELQPPFSSTHETTLNYSNQIEQTNS